MERILIVAGILVVLLAMYLYGRALLDEFNSLPGNDLGSLEDDQ